MQIHLLHFDWRNKVDFAHIKHQCDLTGQHHMSDLQRIQWRVTCGYWWQWHAVSVSACACLLTLWLRSILKPRPFYWQMREIRGSVGYQVGHKNNIRYESMCKYAYVAVEMLQRKEGCVGMPFCREHAVSYMSGQSPGWVTPATCLFTIQLNPSLTFFFSSDSMKLKNTLDS